MAGQRSTALNWKQLCCSEIPGDSRLGLDPILEKNFVITESKRLQFRAEAFNITNTPTFAVPGAAIGSSAAGVVTSTLNSNRVLHRFAIAPIRLPNALRRAHHVLFPLARHAHDHAEGDRSAWTFAPFLIAQLVHHFSVPTRESPRKKYSFTVAGRA
jgi:hypothetical protein